MPNLKFLAQTVSEIRRDPKIPKVGHVTPSRADMDYLSCDKRCHGWVDNEQTLAAQSDVLVIMSEGYLYGPG